MTGPTNDLMKIIAEDKAKYDGIRRPLKAGLLERLFVGKIACDRLHVNPDDEFSDPKIGPSMRIIGEYGEAIQRAHRFSEPIFSEPVQVEKMAPDGYLMLNGHHRWGAAMRYREPNIRVQIVNVTHEKDVEKMMDRSANSRRISFDLDEVLLADGRDDVPAEKPKFPGSLLYRQRLRAGAAALISALRNKGYDVWVYTAGYYSTAYIQGLFGGYGVKVDGIINGVNKKRAGKAENSSGLKEKIRAKYPVSVHADNETLVWTDARQKHFRVEELNMKTPAEWSSCIQETLGRLEKETEIS